MKLESEKRRESPRIKFIQAVALLLTASFSYVAACAWNNVIKAQVGSSITTNIPYEVACTTTNSCPEKSYQRQIGNCSSVNSESKKEAFAL